MNIISKRFNRGK